MGKYEDHTDQGRYPVMYSGPRISQKKSRNPWRALSLFLIILLGMGILVAISRNG